MKNIFRYTLDDQVVHAMLVSNLRIRWQGAGLPEETCQYLFDAGIPA